MRPVSKGDSPVQGDFNDYRDAYRELVARLGNYCSYCERRIQANLAVEHIQPKDANRYPQLEKRWSNFLLACVNCNSTKGDKDVLLDQVLLPDRDNTFNALTYPRDGKVQVASHLTGNLKAMADRLVKLVGLSKKVREYFDANGKLIAIDRSSQRKDVWLIAEESKIDLASNPTDAMRRQVIKTAKAEGFFSIWMEVFTGDPVMRNKLIEAFKGTAADCFDATTTAVVSPRPVNNNLDHSGKL